MRSPLTGRIRLLIFFGAFVIFWLSPVTGPSDAQFALLTAESLLTHGTPSLSGYRIAGLDPLALPASRRLPPPHPFYQLVRIDGRVLYIYPHGGSLLALPFVAAFDVLGISPAANNGIYNEATELLLEKLLASLVSAATAALFFDIGLKAEVPVLWSVILAAGGALGSQIWSSGSRTLWSQTWEVLLTSAAILLLLRGNQRRLRSNWLATCLAWLFFVRPTGALSIVGVTLFLWFRHRDALRSYLSVLLLWILAFVGYWMATFGEVLPDYYRQGSLLELGRALSILPAILMSPSRGLLVFVPTIPIAVYLLVHYWKAIDHQLAVLAGAVICGNLLVVASYPVWWGGWSYGPRLLTGTIPWFVLLGALGCRCLARDVCRSITVLGSGLSLLLLAMAINGWGAMSWAPVLWNKQAAINERPAVAWDWRHPQFLAGL